MVDIFERLGFFRVFSAPWFIFLLTLLVVSIVVCTLDRTPNLWRTAHRVKIVQAAPFYDLRLAERARFTAADNAAADDLGRVLQGKRYRVREQVTDTEAGPIRHI
jgi:cytochrome c biogenesis protein